ncbi:MAG: 5-(carboxyamino)imidazole ribonucleotide synthase [Chloroflexota bacterium]
MPNTTADPILPPATIGILGGGQLGRMLGFAARALGYRIRVLDPDPGCPAAAIADHVEVGSYHDVAAALRMAEGCSVVTYELEHIDAAIVEALLPRLPVRPGLTPLRVTQDRLAERRFVEGNGVPVAPWRQVTVGDTPALERVAAVLGLPLRVKAAFGGYDGRSQIRFTTLDEVHRAWVLLGAQTGLEVLVEQELAFDQELSVVCARSVDGHTQPFPPASNRHQRGILAESVLPAQVPDAVALEAQAIAVHLANAMDLTGLLTVELFLLPGDRLVVNELAPRVHNSGHATIEASATSQFEQHVRAICGLGLGSAQTLSPAAMVNLIGDGERRPARLLGAADALDDPAVHLHLYDKRDVFRGRKMGHLTALGPDAATALTRATAAHARLRWADDRSGDAPAADGPESAA